MQKKGFPTSDSEKLFFPGAQDLDAYLPAMVLILKPPP